MSVAACTCDTNKTLEINEIYVEILCYVKLSTLYGLMSIMHVNNATILIEYFTIYFFV